MLFQIFTAQASDASSLVVNHGGGQVEIVIGGSFGGGTVTAVARYPGTSTWVPLDGGEWTAPLVKRRGLTVLTQTEYVNTPT